MTWKELPTIDPKDYDVRTVPALLRMRRVDPWADLVETKQTLPRDLVKALQKES